LSTRSRVLLAVVVCLLMLALPAQALGSIRITKIYYNSPGSDTGSNASLNAEYIVVKNTGSQGKQIGGWRIRDVANHAYRFADGTKIAAGSTITVHTGSGSNTARHKYWGQGWYVWNNDGDTARLRKPSGALVDTCSYSGGSSSATC
jgi:hypothetical protein